MLTVSFYLSVHPWDLLQLFVAVHYSFKSFPCGISMGKVWTLSGSANSM